MKILCSKSAAREALGGIGKTKLDELIAKGQLETVRIGTRRLVKIASVKRLAGIATDQEGGSLSHDPQ
ncbi:MAG: putative excisionase [Sphingomonadales bacterium]|nr:putative excisionase [Sphingomonadales bacterium]